jgi:hypothetical protein
MADTERTVAELLVLLADNTTGAISEQDIRDMLVSLADSYGGLHISAAVETSIAATSMDGSNAVKILGTTVISTANRGMDMPANNRLRYTGAPTRFFELNAVLSVISASSNKVFGFYLAKNGTVDTGSLITRKQGTSTDVGALALNYHVRLTTNDYVEVFIENQTDNTNMTVNQMVISARGLIE